MVRAAVEYAAGRPAPVTASLRVYALSKAMGSPLCDPMADYELFREWECYAAAEAEQSRAQERRAAATGRARRR